MSVDRMTYKIPFHKGRQPEWICPTCDKGILKGKKGSFVLNETKSSKEVHENIDWEPMWIQYVYSCQFICTNPSCGEIVFSVGTGTVDENYRLDDEGIPEASYSDIFEPSFFVPHLKIFHVPETTPGDIKKSIDGSFELFFANPSASAGHLRIALEELLNYLKIKKTQTIKGSRRIISLHKRINLLPNKFDELKDLFFAIKWLGNDGSHIVKTTKDDVMDAYDFFELILDEVFENKKKETKRLAKKINKKRN